MQIVRPEEVGLSSERLARIDQHLEQRYLAHKKIAGALTLVARRGRIAHLAPVGMMDVALQQATIKLLNSPAFRHPVHWAGFTFLSGIK